MSAGGVTRWRKRPVTVEAVRWTGDNAAELAGFTGSRFGIVDPEDRTDAPELTGQVFDVLHSTWVGMSTGQWVIRGVRGEFYPCDDAVLAETYDPAGEEGGAACRTVTREGLAGALAALPLGEFLTPEARTRFAGALLEQMPAPPATSAEAACTAEDAAIARWLDGFGESLRHDTECGYGADSRAAMAWVCHLAATHIRTGHMEPAP